MGEGSGDRFLALGVTLLPGHTQHMPSTLLSLTIRNWSGHVVQEMVAYFFAQMVLRYAGTRDPLLQYCNACTWANLSGNKIQKKLHGAKNNCVHTQLGQIMDKSHRTTKKPQLPLLQSQEQKLFIRCKSRAMSMPSALTTTSEKVNMLFAQS